MNNVLEIMTLIKNIKNKFNLEFKYFEIKDYIISKKKKELLIKFDDIEKIIDINDFKINNPHMLDNYIDKKIEYKELSDDLKEIKKIVDELLEQINKELEDFYLSSIKKKEIVKEVIKNINQIKNKNSNIDITSKEIIYKLLLQSIVSLNKENIDDLTNLYNSKFLKFLFHGNRKSDKELKEKLLKQVGGNEEKLYVFFLDLNNFKNINDNYGHDIGDKVLINFANSLKKITTINNKSKSIIARKGGDEFILVVNKKVAKNLIKIFTSKEYINNLTKSIPNSINKPTVSSSFGISVIKDDNIKEAINNADKKLQITKNIFHYLLDPKNTRHDKISKEVFNKNINLLLKDIKKEFGINELNIYKKKFNLNIKTKEL